MDVREKLVGLVHNARMNALWHNAQKPDEYITDMLMEDGVTVQEWISVNDRLPEDLNDVLIFTMWRTMDVCFFDKEYECWISTNGSYNKDCVTHWMPLPRPPKKKGGE